MINTMGPKMLKSTVFQSFFHLIESFFYLIHGREKGHRSRAPRWTSAQVCTIAA